MNNCPEILLDCSDYVIPDCTPVKAGALDGLRLGVKDLFHIAGLPTTAGNPDWANTHELPTQTSSVVKTLVEQGAHLCSKTLTDEIAYSLNGVNAHFGTPVNPADPSRIPGGSSSGSAIAVANGTVDIGLGTDTGGSIRVPASYNGLYGFRPSHGIVAVDNLVGLAPGFDTVGWLTRDLETLLKVVDQLVVTSESLMPSNNAIQELVIVIPEGAIQWQAIVEKIAPKLEAFLANDAVKVKTKPLSASICTKASNAFRILQGRQIWREHGAWVLECNPTFAPDIHERLQWCQGLSADDEREAEVLSQAFIEFWQSEFISSAASAVMFATTPGAAPKLDISAEDIAHYRNCLMGLTAPAGLTKAPQISLPLMTDQQAPWGVSLIGQQLADKALLNLAARINNRELFLV